MGRVGGLCPERAEMGLLGEGECEETVWVALPSRSFLTLCVHLHKEHPSHAQQCWNL